MQGQGTQFHFNAVLAGRGRAGRGRFAQARPDSGSHGVVDGMVVVVVVVVGLELPHGGVGRGEDDEGGGVGR